MNNKNKKEILKPILEFKNFNFFYSKNDPKSLVLKNINLKIYPKKVTVIIGASGCGKSTLLRSINRMNEIQSDCKNEGLILLNDKSIFDKKINPEKLRREVGLVFQKPTPFKKSIFENIAFALRVNNKLTEIEIKSKVIESLKSVNLWEEVKERLYDSALDLSGGQQQRLCIARCIVNEPNIILMDEPTSSLDPISKNKIENLIFSLKKKYTIILITHSLSQASKISDFLIFMNNGKIVETGKTRHVFTQPKEELTSLYITGRMND